MAEDLRGRLEILREIERVEALIQRARQSTALSEERANRYVEEQKTK
jgi:RNase P subunit RPR2